MIIVNEKVEQGALLAIWKVEERIEELLDILPNREKHIEALAKFGSDKRKLEYLAARVLINNMLNDEKEVAYLPSGAPYLTDNSYQLSIAHTGNYVVVILHPTNKVGVDIERMQDKVVRVQHKFLSTQELTMVKDNSKSHLALLWAAKEALYKVVGVEVVDFTKDFMITPFEAYLEGNITAKETVSPQQRTYQLSYRVLPEYVLVWTIQA